MGWEEMLWKVGIPVINALIATFVIPWLVRLSEKAKDNKIMNFIRQAVLGAEQEFGPSTILGSVSEIKFDTVVSAVIKKFGMQDNEILKSLIESAVKEMKEQGREYKEQTKVQQTNVKKVSSNSGTAGISFK